MNELFCWILLQSVKASVLITIIFSLRFLLGDRISPRCRYVAWLFIPISLFLVLPLSFPFTPTIPQRDFVQKTGQTQNVSTDSATEELPTEIRIDWDLLSENFPDGKQEQDVLSSQKFVFLLNVFEKTSRQLSKGLIPWLFGMTVLLLVFSVQIFRCRRLLRNSSPITDPKILETFEQCRRRINLNCWVVLNQSESISSPFLFGVLRPVVLLPSRMIEHLTPENLQHVFLHELIHLKRGDLVFGWIMSAALTVHWFNPLLWFAIRRMNIDREEACDAAVLARLEQQKRNRYGNTLLDIASFRSGATDVPLVSPIRTGMLAGIFEAQSLLHRRIQMIRQIKRQSTSWNVLFFAAAISAALPLLGHFHAEAKDEKKDEENQAADDFDKDDPSAEFTVDKQIKPGKYSGKEAQQIGSQIIAKADEVNRCWLHAPKWDAKRWTYTFRAQLASGEKTEKKKKLDREDPGAPSDWPSIRGNTLISIPQGLCEFVLHEAGSVDIVNAEITAEIQKAQAKLHFRFNGSKSAFRMAGNGLDGSWYGFFQGKATEGMIYINLDDYTITGVKLPGGGFEKYTDYVSLDETFKVPRRVEIQNGDMHFDMRFKAYEPGIWLLDRSEYKFEKKKTSVATLNDLTINGIAPVEIKEEKKTSK